MAGQHPAIQKWVDEISKLTTPDRVVWCDGSESERDALIKECLATGELIELNQQKLPGCYLHRSAPHDVARTEHLTFVCSKDKEDAGPEQQLDVAAGGARAKLTPLFRGAMKGRTMYVVPFLMGPPGLAVLQGRRRDHRLDVRRPQHAHHDAHGAGRRSSTSASGDDFTRCLHSLGDLSPERRFICHFPEENTVWSIGSGYGGNALLGKKCLALRLASLAGQEGRLARRAHADPRARPRPRGSKHYITRGVPVGVRQDQPGDAGAAGVDAGLEGRDRRRRHRLAAAGRRRAAVGGQPRGRLLRRRAGHLAQDQPERVRR